MPHLPEVRVRVSPLATTGRESAVGSEADSGSRASTTRRVYKAMRASGIVKNDRGPAAENVNRLVAE
jgi:hypothetical protein